MKPTWSAEPTTLELDVIPPGPPGTKPWWTVHWDGTRAAIRSAADIKGDQPDDWGIACLDPEPIDAWRSEGGTAYVIKQIIDGVAGSGATAQIVRMHGSADGRTQLLETLQAFVAENPQCSAELRRFVDAASSA